VNARNIQFRDEDVTMILKGKVLYQAPVQKRENQGCSKYIQNYRLVHEAGKIGIQRCPEEREVSVQRYDYRLSTCRGRPVGQVQVATRRMTPI